MARAIINIPANTWIVLPDSEFGINFQVLGDRECFWKYSFAEPTDKPFAEPVFKALPGEIIKTASSREELIWLYAAGHSENVAYDDHSDIDVIKQDYTARDVIVKFNNVLASTTLSVAAVRDTRTITVTNPAGFIAGRYIILFDPINSKYSFYTQLGAPVGNDITLDTPLDFSFPAGTNADSCSINLAVDGSVTPQIFGLRGHTAIPGVAVTVDITRIIITALTASAVSLEKFADIAALSRGLVLRQRNGDYQNIFNAKSNAELAGLTLDWVPYVATNPAQNLNGFVCRLTFNGDDKLGVVKRLRIGEDLEFIVQDNLTGITSLTVIAQGHQVR